MGKTITCPKCRHTQKVDLPDSANVTLEPEMKAKIMMNDFFKMKCERCGNETPISFDFIYHDTNNRIMIYLLPTYSKKYDDSLDTVGNAMLSNSPDYTLRIVKTPNELIEKVKIYDAGRDDRYVEILKILMLLDFAQSRPDFRIKHIFFDSRQGEDAFVMFNEGGEMISEKFSEETYANIANTYSMSGKFGKTHAFLHIDRNWALSLL